MEYNFNVTYCFFYLMSFGLLIPCVTILCETELRYIYGVNSQEITQCHMAVGVKHFDQMLMVFC